jgi:malonyl CoA-acyl carrier protein transacylase
MRKTFSNVLMKLGLLLIVLGAATGCAKLTVSSATEKALCRSFRPVAWSGKDTSQTIREVKSHNAVWKAICQ